MHQPPQSERASSWPAAKGGRLNNTGVTAERLSISSKDQGGSGHHQAAAAHMKDALEDSATEDSTPVPSSGTHQQPCTAQLLQCPSSQPQARGHSPAAASQGLRGPDPEKVLSSPAQGVQNLCPLSKPLIHLCITWVPLSRAHSGVHTHCSACMQHMPSPPSQSSSPCTALQARRLGRWAQWVELSWQGLGKCELSSNEANPGAFPRAWVPCEMGRCHLPQASTDIKEGSSRLQPGTPGHKGTGEEQPQPLQPLHPQSLALGAA